MIVSRYHRPWEPDVEGAAERHPLWTFTEEVPAVRYVARRTDGSATLESRAIETLESKVKAYDRAHGEAQESEPADIPPDFADASLDA